MRRPLAADAEVADGADQPFAEMVLPDAIDDHPRQQRPGPVLDVGDPVGQRPPLAACFVLGGPSRRAAVQ